jgi:hypothetical protein
MIERLLELSVFGSSPFFNSSDGANEECRCHVTVINQFGFSQSIDQSDLGTIISELLRLKLIGHVLLALPLPVVISFSSISE